MPQVLLRSNRRITTLIATLAGLGFAVAAITMWCWPGNSMVRWACILVALACFGCGISAVQMFRKPRLALTSAELLVFVRLFGKPFRVPIEFVEVFFLGQGAVAGTEPGHPKEYRGAVAANVIVRLAEADNSWHVRSINQWLGVWAEGYITIRGLWCENIDQELMKKMNQSLMAAKRDARKGGRE